MMIYRLQITTCISLLLTNVVSSFERFMPEASVDDGYMRLVILKNTLSSTSSRFYRLS